MLHMLIELTVRNMYNLDQVAEKVLSISPSVTQIGLTNKNGMPDNIEVYNVLKDMLPGIEFVTYYSFKNHTNRDEETIRYNIESYIDRAKEAGIKKILLVSGYPKPKFDVLAGLEYLSTFPDNSIQLGVAFNPFLEGKELEAEKNRLEQKLAFSNVQDVYLQIGDNEKKFDDGIELIRSIRDEVRIFGTCMVPTNYTLTKFANRPWKGVMVSDMFTESQNQALEITQKMLGIMEMHKVVPLLSIDTITPNGLEVLEILTNNKN